MLKLKTILPLLHLAKQNIFPRYLLSATRYSASFLKQSKGCKFPYRIGGLSKGMTQKIQNPEHNRVNQQMMKILFGDNIMQNFVNAYKEIVSALQQKDKQYLQTLMQKNLTKNIQFPNTKLQNQQADVQTYVGKVTIIAYGCFDRNKLSKFAIKKFRNYDDQQLQTLIVPEGQPCLLFVFQIYFKSKMKLALLNRSSSSTQQSQEDSSQTHMIQFQIQSQIDNIPLFSKGFMIMIKNLFNFQNMAIQFAKLILGQNTENFQWKIGDVDQLLGGNHTKPTQGL